MIEIILKSILVLYFLFGFISWLIGMKAFGGSKAYKEHLRRETKHSNLFFYVVFICFIRSREVPAERSRNTRAARARQRSS